MEREARKRRARRARWPGAITVVVALASVPVAPAPAAEVSVRGGTLAYVEGAGELNVVDVVPAWTPYAPGYNVFEDAARLQAGPGCVARTPRWAQCWAPVDAVRVEAGERADLITLRGIEVPARVAGGAGSDLIEGGRGDDVIDAGTGTDTVVGGDGDDALSGGDGGDLLEGSDGGDALAGQAGDDVISGQAGGGDALTGGPGRDLLSGGAGDDRMDGGGGADAVVGSEGTDQLVDPAGNDSFVRSADPDSRVRCGAPRRLNPRLRSVVCRLAVAPPREQPKIWPPPPDGARAAGPPPPKPKVRVRPRRRGNARYLTVRVLDKYFYKARIRIRLYDRKGRRLRTMLVSVDTRNPQNLRRPRPARRAYSARGLCCF